MEILLFICALFFFLGLGILIMQAVVIALLAVKHEDPSGNIFLLFLGAIVTASAFVGVVNSIAAIMQSRFLPPA